MKDKKLKSLWLKEYLLKKVDVIADCYFENSGEGWMAANSLRKKLRKIIKEYLKD